MGDQAGVRRGDDDPQGRPDHHGQAGGGPQDAGPWRGRRLSPGPISPRCEALEMKPGSHLGVCIPGQNAQGTVGNGAGRSVDPMHRVPSGVKWGHVVPGACRRVPSRVKSRAGALGPRVHAHPGLLRSLPQVRADWDWEEDWGLEFILEAFDCGGKRTHRERLRERGERGREREMHSRDVHSASESRLTAWL